MNDAMLTELRQIREAIKRLTARATTPRWGDITTTAREFGVSPVFLRRCLRDETYPLPAKKGGRQMAGGFIGHAQLGTRLSGRATKAE
jgi:hypothetical protein